MFETQKLASHLTGGLGLAVRGTPPRGVGGLVDRIFSCLVCVLLFLLCVLVWLVRLRLIRLCRVVFAFVLACWLRLWLLLRLGLASRPVFDACGCFVLAVFPVAAAMFWSRPALSVVGVAEVPLVCGCDWLSAFGAGVCFACGQSCLPCPAEVAVCCVVSSCR